MWQLLNNPTDDTQHQHHKSQKHRSRSYPRFHLHKPQDDQQTHQCSCHYYPSTSSLHTLLVYMQNYNKFKLTKRTTLPCPGVGVGVVCGTQIRPTSTAC